MEGSTNVTIGDSSFDLAGIGGWIEAHFWVFLLVAAVLFIFFIFQKGGFAEKFLDYRLRRSELDAQRVKDSKDLATIFMRRHDRPDPLLPFDISERGPNE